jgi:biopolymer transport protein TolR
MRVPNSYAVIFVAVLVMPLPVLVIDYYSRHPDIYGLPVYIAVPPKSCADGGPIVVQVHHGGSLNLNSETLERGGLENRLKEVFATRAERLLFVNGDPDVDFGEVAQIIDIARTQADYVALITPSIEKDLRERPFCCCLTIIPRKGTVQWK